MSSYAAFKKSSDSWYNSEYAKINKLLLSGKLPPGLFSYKRRLENWKSFTDDDKAGLINAVTGKSFKYDLPAIIKDADMSGVQTGDTLKVLEQRLVVIQALQNGASPTAVKRLVAKATALGDNSLADAVKTYRKINRVIKKREAKAADFVYRNKQEISDIAQNRKSTQPAASEEQTTKYGKTTTLQNAHRAANAFRANHDRYARYLAWKSGHLQVDPDSMVASLYKDQLQREQYLRAAGVYKEVNGLDENVAPYASNIQSQVRSKDNVAENSNLGRVGDKQGSLNKAMLRSADVDAVNKSAEMDPKSVNANGIPKNADPYSFAINNPRMDDMMFPEGTLRPQYLIGTPAEVVPTPMDQVRSDVQFDMFSQVAPGFGQGSDNKLFRENVNRDEKIRFAGPMYAPGTYMGPSMLPTPAAWQLQTVMSMSNVTESLTKLQNAINRTAETLIAAPQPHALPDVLNDIPSSKQLPRPNMNVLEPVINNDSTRISTCIPAGVYRQAWDWRSNTDPQRRHRLVPADPANGGPALKKRRALEVLLP